MVANETKAWPFFDSVLQRHFPNGPKTRGQFHLRLAVGVFFSVIGLTGVFIQPFSRSLAVGALWLQFCGAFLLWRESNSVAQVDLAVEEMRRYPPPLPVTKAERILVRGDTVFSYGLLALGVAVVVLSVAVISQPQGLRVLLYNEVKVAAFFGVLLALIIWVYRWLGIQQLRLAESIRAAEDQGGIAQREIARRALRTMGFFLITVATFLQFVLVWVGSKS